MEENVKISILLDIYGKLLTNKQYEILNDYYNNDLSLSEIAENNSITRQAVRDALKKNEKKLLEYEEKMELLKKDLKLEKTLYLIIEELDKLDVNNEKIENIRNMINSLVENK